ncbi:MAG: TerB family tellurite resistance protein [Gemmatimonadaceae bacterium]|nr:TerB family tellurite resistance protein [Gemmatimonadaceae bacterium]
MLSTLKRLLAGAATPASPPRHAAARTPDVQVAACALLVELALADGEFSLQERTVISHALTRHFGLDQAGVAALLHEAEEAVRQSVDHFTFTRDVLTGFDLGQRMVLAEIMWSVILADGELADHEAYLVRKLANLLALEPAYLSEARKNATAATQTTPPANPSA